MSDLLSRPHTLESPTVSELYRDPLLIKKHKLTYGHQFFPGETDLALADHITQQDDIVEELDNLFEQDMDQWYNVKRLFNCMPGQMILDNYGVEMLVWAASNATFSEEGKELANLLVEKADFDYGLLQAAQLWLWQRHFSSLGKKILAHYNIMSAMASGDLLQDIDLSEQIKKAALPGIEISDKRAADYGLIPLQIECPESGYNGEGGWALDWFRETNPGVFYDIWLDAPTGYALTYKGKPNAVVAMALTKTVDEIMIYQLQGVQAKRVNPDKEYTNEYVTGTISARGLAPLDWQKLMVNIGCQVTSGLGLEKLAIQGGCNNYWTKRILRGETEPHLSSQVARKAYDVPAKRLGFTRGSDKNWHTLVSPETELHQSANIISVAS